MITASGFFFSKVVRSWRHCFTDVGFAEFVMNVSTSFADFSFAIRLFFVCVLVIIQISQ